MPLLSLENPTLITLPSARKLLGLTRQGLDYLIKTRGIKTIAISERLKAITIADFEKLQKEERLPSRKKGQKDKTQRLRSKDKQKRIRRFWKKSEITTT